MHAVPIHTKAASHTAVRIATGANRPAATLIDGIHHANALARGLRSQSRDHSPLPEWTELPIELREVMIHLFYADVRHGGGS